jgi:hypothetical protein
MRVFIDILESLAVSIFTKALLVLCFEAKDSPVFQNIYKLPNYSHFFQQRMGKLS